MGRTRVVVLVVVLGCLGSDRHDAGVDAGADAGVDAGVDAEVDAGVDPGPTCEGAQASPISNHWRGDALEAAPWDSLAPDGGGCLGRCALDGLAEARVLDGGQLQLRWLEGGSLTWRLDAGVVAPPELRAGQVLVSWREERHLDWASAPVLFERRVVVRELDGGLLWAGRASEESTGAFDASGPPLPLLEEVFGTGTSVALTPACSYVEVQAWGCIAIHRTRWDLQVSGPGEATLPSGALGRHDTDTGRWDVLWSWTTDRVVLPSGPFCIADWPGPMGERAWSVRRVR